MVDAQQIQPASYAAQLAAALPPYDPLAPTGEGARARRLLAISLALHLTLLLVFWDSIIGVVIEVENTVVVRMMEEPEPEPEQPKLQRKVLAQRRIDTTVRRFREISQPEIVQVRPVQVLDQAQKVEVQRIQVTEAPKQITNRQIVTRTVSAFAETPTQVQPIEVGQVSPSVRQVRAARASAGPRRLEASGPRVDTTAVNVQAPRVTRGQISQNAVEGDVEGAHIAAIESGTADRMLKGEGRSGSLTGIDKNCDDDPICIAYLKMIRDRVYGRWTPGVDVESGAVRLRFRLDRGGSAHNIQLVSADDKLLGDTCVVAFRHASPFPPPPKEIHYIVNKGIIARFDYETGQ